MRYDQKIYPDAKAERNWLYQTYGDEFSHAFETWCQTIAECAPDNPGKLTLIPLEDVLGEGNSKWQYLWQMVKERTTLDRLKSLIHFLKHRTPPLDIYATRGRFFAQRSFWITVETAVEVDRANKQVNFIVFNWYGE